MTYLVFLYYSITVLFYCWITGELYSVLLCSCISVLLYYYWGTYLVLFVITASIQFFFNSFYDCLCSLCKTKKFMLLCMICTNPIKFDNFTQEIAEENSQYFKRSIISLLKYTTGEFQPKVNSPLLKPDECKGNHTIADLR